MLLSYRALPPFEINTGCQKGGYGRGLAEFRWRLARAFPKCVRKTRLTGKAKLHGNRLDGLRGLQKESLRDTYAFAASVDGYTHPEAALERRGQLLH